MQKFLYFFIALFFLPLTTGCEINDGDKYLHEYPLAIRFENTDGKCLANGIQTRPDEPRDVLPSQYDVAVSGKYLDNNRRSKLAQDQRDGDCWLLWGDNTIGEPKVVPQITLSLKCQYIFGTYDYYDVTTYWTLDDRHNPVCEKALFQGQQCDVTYNPEYGDYEIMIRVDRD